jgi:acetoin utilization protein AcuB
MIVTTKRVICVRPEATLGNAYELMRENAIRHLPVLDGTRLVGIISDRDLLMFGNPVSDDELSFPTLPVSRLMSKDLVTATPETTLAEAAASMLQARLDSLPIVAADGALVGLVTTSDFLELASNTGGSEPLPFRFELSTPEDRPAGERRAQD